jgi:hypothetical protein
MTTFIIIIIIIIISKHVMMVEKTETYSVTTFNKHQYWDRKVFTDGHVVWK